MTVYREKDFNGTLLTLTLLEYPEICTFVVVTLEFARVLQKLFAITLLHNRDQETIAAKIYNHYAARKSFFISCGNIDDRLENFLLQNLCQWERDITPCSYQETNIDDGFSPLLKQPLDADVR